MNRQSAEDSRDDLSRIARLSESKLTRCALYATRIAIVVNDNVERGNCMATILQAFAIVGLATVGGIGATALALAWNRRDPGIVIERGATRSMQNDAGFWLADS